METQAPAHVTLEAVDAVSANDVWAVGSYEARDLASSAYILHWDGARWVSLPRQQRKTAEALLAVSASSASDVWAVGVSANAGDTQYTLIEHWDGSQWTIIPSPSARVGNACM